MNGLLDTRTFAHGDRVRVIEDGWPFTGQLATVVGVLPHDGLTQADEPVRWYTYRVRVDDGTTVRLSADELEAA